MNNYLFSILAMLLGITLAFTSPTTAVKAVSLYDTQTIKSTVVTKTTHQKQINNKDIKVALQDTPAVKRKATKRRTRHAEITIIAATSTNQLTPIPEIRGLFEDMQLVAYSNPLTGEIDFELLNRLENNELLLAAAG